MLSVPLITDHNNVICRFCNGRNGRRIAVNLFRLFISFLFCLMMALPGFAMTEPVEAAEAYLFDKVIQWPDGTTEHVQIGADGYFILDGVKKRLVGTNLGFGTSYDEEECYWLPENVERMDKILGYLESVGVRIVEFEPESIWHYGGEAGEEYERYSTVLDLVYQHKMLVMPHFVARHQPDAEDLSDCDFMMGYCDDTDTVGEWASRFADVMANYPNTVSLILGNELNIPYDEYEYQPANVANYLQFIKDIMISKVDVPVVSNFAAYSEDNALVHDEIVSAGMAVTDWPCFTHYGDSLGLYNSRIEVLTNWLDSHGYESSGYWIEETNFSSWSPPDASQFTTEYLDILFEHGASIALLHTTLAPNNPGYSFFTAEGDPIQSMVAIGEEISRLQAPLSVSDVPPAGSTETAVNVTSSSAELVGIVSDLGSAATVDVSFYWGHTAESMDNETHTDTVSSTGSFSIGIAGLNPETTYYYRLKAQGDGVSYGEIESFITGPSGVQEPAGPPSVDTNAATDITTGTVTLTGTLTDLNGADSVSTAFLVGTSQERPDKEYASEVLTETGAFSLTITDLLPDTTYYFRSKAVGTETGYGEIKSFTTPKENIVKIIQKSPEVVTLEASAVESTSAVLKGHILSMGDASELECYFLYGTTSECDQGETGKTILAESGDFDAEIHGLIPATTYYFTARVSGTQTPYDSKSFETPGISPSTISQPPQLALRGARDIKRTSVIIGCTVLDLGTASSVEVVFDYGKTPSCEAGRIGPVVCSATGTCEMKLNRLETGTRYYYRATISGDGVIIGEVQEFTTLSNGNVNRQTAPGKVIGANTNTGPQRSWGSGIPSLRISFRTGYYQL